MLEQLFKSILMGVATKEKRTAETLRRGVCGYIPRFHGRDSRYRVQLPVWPVGSLSLFLSLRLRVSGVRLGLSGLPKRLFPHDSLRFLDDHDLISSYVGVGFSKT